jgi:hypothetical protein
MQTFAFHFGILNYLTAKKLPLERASNMKMDVVPLFAREKGCDRRYIKKTQWLSGGVVRK